VNSVPQPSGGQVLKQGGVSVTTGVDGHAVLTGGNVVVFNSMQSSTVQGALNPAQNVGAAVVVYV